MTAVSKIFASCRRRQRAALIPYMTAGFPNEQAFLELMKAAAGSGADIIEVGLPFSDPLADGPTIQRASQQALARGVTVDSTLRLLASLRDDQFPPIVIMSYMNPLLQFGISRFAVSARQVGVHGLIIPDTIPEESQHIAASCRAEGVDFIHLLAPTSPPHRQQLILKHSRGFVYLVSVMGVTGARRALPDGLLDWITDVKSKSDLPVAVGFGISTTSQARRVAQVADGVIVGSAIIDIIQANSGRRDMIANVEKFLRQLGRSLHRGAIPSDKSK